MTDVRKKLMCGAIGLAILLLIGGTTFLGDRLLNSEQIKAVTENKDNPTPEQQAIIDTDFETKEVITKSELMRYKDVYNMMHEMANGKIIARDGKIWGIQPMTQDRIEACRNALLRIDPDHKELFEILDSWESKDYSNCVDQHNYIWALLGGTVGEAVRLRNDE